MRKNMSIDQEDERRRLSSMILNEFADAFDIKGVKVTNTKNAITVNGVKFTLMDTPSDVHNDVIYIVSPDKQSIPIRKENFDEAIDVVLSYIDTQVGKSHRMGKDMTFKQIRKGLLSKGFDVDNIFRDLRFDPNGFSQGLDDAVQRQLMDDPDFRRLEEFKQRWENAGNNPRGHISDADDIRQPIRDWYLNAYPTDDLGRSLSDATFYDLYSGMSSGLNVYDRMGVGDSIIRERLFERLAELKGVTYGDIYDLWLSTANKGVRKGGYSIRDVSVGDTYVSRGGSEVLEVTDVRPEFGWVLGWYTTNRYGTVEGNLEDVCWTIDEFNEWVRLNNVNIIKARKGVRKSRRSITKSDGGIGPLMDEMVEIGILMDDGRIGIRTMTLREAMSWYGVRYLGDPNDYRQFARCPKLVGLVGPMKPNEGFVARYETPGSYDALSM